MDYKQTSKQARLNILDLIYKAQTSHIGSNFSCVDIMNVLFDKIDLDKDKFILSKGWAAATLYYFLYKKGRILREDLDSYCQPGSKFIGLAEPIHKDIPFAGGSIGMGLSAGVGFSLSKQLKREHGKVYVLESDGGMQCGINWEAIAFASHHKLNNLVLIIDDNGLQAMGEVKDIFGRNNFIGKFSAFGWDYWMLDGHDFSQLDSVFTHLNRCDNQARPLVILASTVKGKGVSFMEDNNLYHYKQLSDEEYKLAEEELCKE